MAWWINTTQEVIDGVRSFGLGDPVSILEAVEQYLSHYGDTWATERWQKCPEKYFVYTHLLLVQGRLHTLEFVVEDVSKAVGVLHLVWVENYPGDPLP